ncbi:MAG: LysR substrate-binding domain-containing protein [Rubrivivax sp.]|nr:LysR substrate-binding domain-containing protein [Rubrivivax sp.]
MPDRLHALTPDALVMMDTIARAGSFAAAARELGKVPSALTYSVRQLEEALDALLFDRSSRQAQLTPAGTELLHEGRRLLQEMQAVSNRVRRVAKGWETQLSISVEDILSQPTVFELVEAFCGLCDGRGASNGGGAADGGDGSRPGTRLRLRTDVLAGTWEALVSGQVDLAIGVKGDLPNPGGVELRPLGEMTFVFCVAPHHALAAVETPLDDTVLVRQRAVAVADTAQRLTPVTVGLLPGQDVLTVPHTRAKLEALLRGLGCGHLPEPLARPHLEAGHLVRKTTTQGDRLVRLFYAWRAEHGRQSLGRALQWWLGQLESPATRRALIERHAGPLD